MMKFIDHIGIRRSESSIPFFHKLFAGWLQSKTHQRDRDDRSGPLILAVDGQTAWRILVAKEGHDALHPVSIRASEFGLSPGRVDDPSVTFATGAIGRQSEFMRSTVRTPPLLAKVDEMERAGGSVVFLGETILISGNSGAGRRTLSRSYYTQG